MISETPRKDSVRGQVGQGIFSLAELKLFVSFHGGPGAADEVPRWLKTSLNPVAHQVRSPDYSFADLISLLVVFELRRHGMKPRRIKEAEKYLRVLWNQDRPFVSEEIATDGATVLIPSEEPGQVTQTEI